MVQHRKGYQQGLTKYSTSTNEFQKAVNLELQQNRLSTRINRPFNFHERVPKSRQSEGAISHMRKNQKVTVLPDRLGERIHLELECHPIQLHYSISPEYA